MWADNVVYSTWCRYDLAACLSYGRHEHLLPLIHPTTYYSWPACVHLIALHLLHERALVTYRLFTHYQHTRR